MDQTVGEHKSGWQEGAMMGIVGTDTVCVPTCASKHQIFLDENFYDVGKRAGIKNVLSNAKAAKPSDACPFGP